jgi:hypothetical protein
MVILALVCMNALLLTQVKRARSGAREYAEAPAPVPGGAPAASGGGVIEVKRGGSGMSGFDAVLCEPAARSDVDEYVLQPVAFQPATPARRGTDYILMRAGGDALFQSRDNRSVGLDPWGNTI